MSTIILATIMLSLFAKVLEIKLHKFIEGDEDVRNTIATVEAESNIV